MENKETLLETLHETQTLENSDYFKYIFKKTEKIVCAVFYVTRSQGNIGQNDVAISDLEKAAKKTLDVALVSLSMSMSTVDQGARQLRHTLISLESALRIAYAVRCVREDILEVFIQEIDSLQRSLKQYTEANIGKAQVFARGGHDTLQGRRQGTSQSASTYTKRAPTAVLTQGMPQVPRRDRIVSILRDKGQATIKDIVAVVTDCSEKTVQRELLGLIKDNIVHREGERRWSKYMLI